VQADICDAGALQRLFQEYTIDYVVNFAAESHVDRSITDPDVFVRTNVMGTLNLLNIAKAVWKTGDDTYRDGVKFQQVSTDEVYGSLGPVGFFTETTPLDPHSPYSASKTSADLFVKAYADTYRLPVTITRCSNNYGPYQFPEKLIPLMINNCLNKKSLPVYGDGMQIRDWLYVEDHCKAIDLVLQKGRAGEVYNVGGHNEQPNIAIVKSIIAYVSEKVDPGINESLIKHVTDRKGHDRRYGIDPTKIKEELGWEPETMFSEGIKKTIDWYLENRQWMEHVTSGSYQHYYQEMYANR
jgi:dTDP-glucose 4,6-dehydratase